MRFKKLRLSGFKSFVRPTELLIEPGLTGVVGPNGCGKSNLVEALRWVMGESSARGLRGGEMDDVIFAGTAGRPAYDLAEVSVQLEADGATIAGHDGADDLELVRRIGRGAGSSFRLNGRELRARDVQLLFADAASGARSAAIVSQGQIGALVEAKPQDRRRLLEDAAGIAGLQARRHEAELKLRGAEANLVRLEDLLIALASQHEQLKKQARQAKRYGEIGARLREVEARLAIGRWLRAQAELEDLRERLAGAEHAAAEAAAGQDRLRERRAQASADLVKLRDEAAEARAAHARLGERARAADLAREERVARLGRSREQVAQLERDRADALTLQEDARAAHARLAEDRVALDAEILELAGALGEAARELDRLTPEAETAARRHRIALTRVGELEARRVQSVEERDRLEEERRALEHRGAEIAASARTLEAPDASAAAGVLASAEAAFAAAERAAGAVESEADQAEVAREGARDAVRDAAERLRRAEQAHGEAEQATARDRQAHAALEARRAELALRLERLTERRAELIQRRAERSTALQDLELERLEQDRQARDEELAAAQAVAATARAALDTACRTLAAADGALGAVRSEIGRAEVEASALAELDTGGDERPVLDSIEVPEELADALAAALGDDLLASLDDGAPVRWGSSAAPAPAPLPEVVRPLAEAVRAPGALVPRLRQVGLCEAGMAAELQERLAPGQRLVSREGDLWRWDGFIRRADALPSLAARLRQHARRRELESQLPVLRERLQEALDEQQAAAATVHAAEAELETRALASAQAARRLQEAEQLLVEARSAERSLTVELAGLDESLAGIDDETASLQPTLDGVLVGLEHAAGQDATGCDELNRERTAAAAAHDDALGAERTLAERLTGLRAELAERRAELERSRRELDRAREAARAAEAEARERRHAEERLEGERQRLAAAIAALGERRREIEARVAQLERDGEAARAALETAAAASGELDQQRSATLAERHALDARHQAVEQRLAQIVQDLEVWRTREAEAGRRVSAVAAREADARRELAALEAAASGPSEADPLRVELDAAEHRARNAEAALGQAEAVVEELGRQLEANEAGRARARELVVRLEAEVERAQEVLGDAQGRLRGRALPHDLEASEEAPDPATLAALEEERAKLDVARERLGAVNLRAVDELRELEMQLETLTAERDELGEAIQRLRRAIGALNREGRERLKAAFGEIEKHFEALFVRLFGGGHARLSLTDLDDPLAAGLELAASPPGKKLQSLSLLSGGEKALTALALIFAVFLSRPSPLCLLDEVDAPLDDANVERLVGLLDELAGATQTRFVVVTHHPLTMAHMDRLYGVTMLERGVSELVSVDLSRAIELRQIA